MLLVKPFNAMQYTIYNTIYNILYNIQCRSVFFSTIGSLALNSTHYSSYITNGVGFTV